MPSHVVARRVLGATSVSSIPRSPGCTGMARTQQTWFNIGSPQLPVVKFSVEDMVERLYLLLVSVFSFFSITMKGIRFFSSQVLFFSGVVSRRCLDTALSSCVELLPLTFVSVFVFRVLIFSHFMLFSPGIINLMLALHFLQRTRSFNVPFCVFDRELTK